MRKWTIATLIAFIVLTSPFTLIGMSLVGSLATHGDITFEHAKLIFHYAREEFDEFRGQFAE